MMAEKKQNETMARQERSDYIFIDCFKSDPNVGALFKDQHNNPITVVRKPVYPPAPYEMDQLSHEQLVNIEDESRSVISNNEDDLGSSIHPLNEASLMNTIDEQTEDQSFMYANNSMINSKIMREDLQKYQEAIHTFKHTQTDIVVPADEDDLAHLCIKGFSKFKSEKKAAKNIKSKKIIWNVKKLQEDLEAASKDCVLAMHYDKKARSSL